MKTRQIVFDIHRLKNEGHSIRTIAKTLGIGRNTVTRYLKDPDRTMAPRLKTASKLDPYKEQIDGFLEKDASVSAMVILHKIQALGYEGQITILRDYLRKQRGRQKRRQAFTLVVHKDFAVRFDANTYTVPPWTIGKKLTLKADQQRIWIYHKNKQVISYPRCWQRKQRIETEAHIEQVKKLQRKNWQTKEIACFASLGEEFRQYLELLPNSKLPLKNQVLMLLDLKDQYGVQSLSVAIMKAMKHKAYGADYIENILYQEMIPQNQHPPVKLKNEALNRIRLTEPTLTDYDAIALKKRKKHD